MAVVWSKMTGGNVGERKVGEKVRKNRCFLSKTAVLMVDDTGLEPVTSRTSNLSQAKTSSTRRADATPCLREGKKKSRAFFERGRALLFCGFDALSKIRGGYRFDRAPDPCGHTPLASDGRKRLWRHPETKEKASQIGGNALVKGEPFKKTKISSKKC